MNDTQRKILHSIDCQELFINEPHLIPAYNDGAMGVRWELEERAKKSKDEKRAYRLGHISRMNDFHDGEI
jgi:hypothetical protein